MQTRIYIPLKNCYKPFVRPVQPILGTYKLSLEPLPGGPVLEFTDYETDITWLSGRIFVLASGGSNATCSHISLHDVSWDVVDDSIEIRGNIGKAEVKIIFTLIGKTRNPVHLREEIIISNPTDDPISFDLLRIGPTWSPPMSWWTYWGYWCLMKLSHGFDPEIDLPSQPGEKLSVINDRLQRWSGKSPTSLMPVSQDQDAFGWIICDGKRFSVIITDTKDRDQICHLDILDRKPHPQFVVGGIKNTTGLDPATSWKSTPVIHIPGRGGWKEAVAEYNRYLKYY